MLLLALALLATIGLAAAPGNPAEAAQASAIRGSVTAAEQCGKCHGVGADDPSPHRITPPLRSLVARYPVAMLREALKTGLITGHDEMPEFDLGKDGVADLLAYIDSLNPDGPSYLQRKR